MLLRKEIQYQVPSVSSLSSTWITVGECEGGVGPAEGVEDARGDSLDVAGDGVRHQLHGRHQETGGQHEAQCHLADWRS